MKIYHAYRAIVFIRAIDDVTLRLRSYGVVGVGQEISLLPGVSQHCNSVCTIGGLHGSWIVVKA
jgi:hypothetical protein